MLTETEGKATTFKGGLLFSFVSFFFFLLILVSCPESGQQCSCRPHTPCSPSERRNMAGSESHSFHPGMLPRCRIGVQAADFAMAN